MQIIIILLYYVSRDEPLSSDSRSCARARCKYDIFIEIICSHEICGLYSVQLKTYDSLEDAYDKNNNNYNIINIIISQNVVQPVCHWRKKHWILYRLNKLPYGYYNE